MGDHIKPSDFKIIRIRKRLLIKIVGTPNQIAWDEPLSKMTVCWCL